MRLCRFNEGRIGLVEGDVIYDVSGVAELLPAMHWPLPLGDALIARLPEIWKRAAELKAGAETFDIADVKLLSPVANPGKIIGAPLNYRAHLAETHASVALHNNAHKTDFGAEERPIDKLGVFLKANSSLIGAGEDIVLNFRDTRRTDHEVELAVVIGKQVRDVSVENALDVVAGYAIGLDTTVRGPEERSFRKSIDTYSTLGPYLVSADEIADPDNLEFWIDVGSERRQHSNTNRLIVGVRELISLCSHWYTLHPGDIIMTGTPEGVSPIKAGDNITAWIEGIGTLKTVVR